MSKNRTEGTGKHYSAIHMIGGGIQSKLLCQMTANASGRKVIAGPVEATALGNIAVQLISLGAIENLDEAFDNGFNNGFDNGAEDKGIRVFKNMINRGFSRKDAQSLAEISDELAERALREC